MLYFITFYFVKFVVVRGLLFSNETQKQSNERREEVGRTGRSRERGTTIGIYCMRKESVFNKRKIYKKGKERKTR